MAFPQSVLLDAWRRTGGRCACTRIQCSVHPYVQYCGRILDPTNTGIRGAKWHAHHRTAEAVGGLDTLANCEILCIPCHEETESYGRRS